MMRQLRHIETTAVLLAVRLTALLIVTCRVAHDGSDGQDYDKTTP